MIWLIVLGILSRLWQFGSVPVSLYWDEIAIGLDARSLIATGMDINGRSWLQPLFYSYGDYKAPVYIWLVTILGQFFGVSEAMIRLPSLLGGLALIGLVYLLVKKLAPGNKLLALMAAANLAIMPWAMHFSRIGFESHLSLFLMTLMVWLVLNKNWLALPLGLLSIYSYISTRLIAPFILAIFSWKQGLRFTVISLAALALGTLFLVKSPDYAASQQYRLSNDNLVNSTTYVTKAQKLTKFLSNYFDFFEFDFLFTRGDPNLRHHSGWGGQLLLAQSVLVIAGLMRPNKLMLFWLLASPVVAALVNETPHASRAIYMIVPLAYFAGVGWQRLGKSKLAWIIPVVLAVNWLFFAHDYFWHYPQRSGKAWISPYKTAALENYPVYPVYIDPKLYKPELYFAFYRNDQSLLKANEKFYYYLPDVCPEGAICLNSF